MSACKCDPTDFPETDCPRHGLYGDIVYPPMNRHARPLPCKTHNDPHCRLCYVKRETAAETQRRLYREALRPRLRFPARSLPPREAMSQR